MVEAFLHLPLWLSVLLVVGGASLLSAYCPVLIRRCIPHERILPNNEVAGFIYAVLGLIYGVILAFVVLYIFEDFSRAQTYVETEAGQVVDLYRQSLGFSEPLRSDLRHRLIQYAEGVVDHEWSEMVHGATDWKMQDSVHELWHRYVTFLPHDRREQTLQAASLKAMSKLADQRRLRLLSAKTCLPGFLWFVLILGGVITLCFSFFFATPNIRAQAMMSGLLAAMISLNLLLILNLDHAFDGKVAVSSEPFRLAIEHIQRGLPSDPGSQ